MFVGECSKAENIGDEFIRVIKDDIGRSRALGLVNTWQVNDWQEYWHDRH
jgi:hypothetical protein